MNNIELLKDRIKNGSNDSLINSNKIITFLNPFSYLFFRNELKVFSDFDIILIDGISLVYLTRLINLNTKRYSFDMTSLAPLVFENCIKNNLSIYFVGSTEKSINIFIKKIKSKYLKLKISGYRNGFFNNSEERHEEIQKIILINPEVVVVGMGTPNQEEFLTSLRNYGWSGSGYTCGGFIHQTATNINYYPRLIKKYNFKWLYRMYDEPKLIKRYFIFYPTSIFLFIIDLMKYKYYKITNKNSHKKN